MNQSKYDVIVVGGGHAGIEAAYASAKMGAKTALISITKNKIGLTPCNPSIGGVGKGHIVFEISAFDGLMPKLCSKTYLQARMLNTKKGPAVQGLRLQIDKIAYAQAAQDYLATVPNLTIIEAMVDEIIVENEQVHGILTAQNEKIYAPHVVLTTGTFLNGLIHIGETNYPAGRRGEKAAIKLANFLTKLNLRMGRLKTGTPPRLATDTINFSKLERQETHDLPYLFEFKEQPVQSSHDCYIARTNEQSHEIIRQNLHRSAMYSGNIEGIGPRYCPSIEDKIARFASKSSHHIFVEPETAEFIESYPSGISTSMPEDVQEAFIHSIAGFEQAKIVKYGYAIEYDFVHPDQLHHTLETKPIAGLFLAGQINGTTGYEEAAGQGLMAGINAACKALNKEQLILNRDESYIGVMIDDLVTMGVDEPYRMFTSRAERRLILRQDNAFLRLTPKGYNLGVVSDEMYQAFCKEKEELEQAIAYIDKHYTAPKLVKILEQHPTNHRAAVQAALPFQVSKRNEVSVYAHMKYREYLKRELKEVEKIKKYQELHIPKLEAIYKIQGLSTEMKQKIERYKPTNIAQASLIPGMTPAALSLLILATRKPELII